MTEPTAILIGVAAACGLLLGATRPVLAIAFLASFVAVTSGLPWHLGLPNVAVPLYYVLGALIGMSYRSLFGTEGDVGSEPANPQSRRLMIGVGLCVGAIAISGVLFAAGSYPFRLRPLLVDLSMAWPEIAMVNPEGVSGALHGLLIPVSGLLIFAMACLHLTTPRARLLMRRAIVGGILVTLASPLVMYSTGMEMLARSDRRYAPGSFSVLIGFAGFFQEPHGFAAYLVLTIGLCLGLTLVYLVGKNFASALFYGTMTVGLGAVLVRTDSRAGLLAGALTMASLGLATPWMYYVAGPSSKERWRAAVYGAMVVVVVMSIGFGSIAFVRAGLADDYLEPVSDWRLTRAIRSDDDFLSALTGRRLLWRKGVVLIQEHPLWGVGPARFRDAPVDLRAEDGSLIRPEALQENAHNYYLQLGAEFGIPALLCFIWLIGSAWLAIVSGALRSEDQTPRGLLLGIAAGQLGFFIICLLSHPLLLSELQAIFWAITGLGVSTAIATPGVRREVEG